MSLNKHLCETLETLAHFAVCNPFLELRIECEKKILGQKYRPLGRVWSNLGEFEIENSNVKLIMVEMESLLDELKMKLRKSGKSLPEAIKEQYRYVAICYLYHLYHDDFQNLIDQYERENVLRHRISFYARFTSDWDKLSSCVMPIEWAHFNPPHIFAVFFQIRRAFYYIFKYLAGSSSFMENLRARIWESVFTKHLGHYIRELHGIMRYIPTLIEGPSGSGKELVAKALSMSTYISFDDQKLQFKHNPKDLWFPINLVALSANLLESELFGHKKGSFTGAVGDKTGWFESCPENGVVFLDEIGELPVEIQVKLLRIIQTREFSAIGDTKIRYFGGRIVSATHKNLSVEVSNHTFREDLFFRLKGNTVVTPALAEQLKEDRQQLDLYISHACKRLVGETMFAESLAKEATLKIRERLPVNYNWPGNMRELEQCVRSILVHGVVLFQNQRQSENELSHILKADMSLEKITQWYMDYVLKKQGNIRETSKILGVDVRTIKARLGFIR